MSIAAMVVLGAYLGLAAYTAQTRWEYEVSYWQRQADYMLLYHNDKREPSMDGAVLRVLLAGLFFFIWWPWKLYATTSYLQR